jgi:hypothetical protein
MSDLRSGRKLASGSPQRRKRESPLTVIAHVDSPSMAASVVSQNRRDMALGTPN